jgi:hypothetical protein
VRRWLSFLVVGGCGAALPPALDTATPYDGPTSIASVTLTCDREAAAWRVEVQTVGWSAGGTLRWTVDGAYVEEHATLRSVAAAPDGSSDRLRADLSIVDDFRVAGANGDTIFLCRAVPDALVWVLDAAGGVADCVQIGPLAPGLAALDGAPPCTRVYAPPADDTDAAAPP